MNNILNQLDKPLHIEVDDSIEDEIKNIKICNEIRKTKIK